MSYDAALAGGVYTATHNGSAIGLTEDGADAEFTPLAEILNKSSAHGNAEIGAIHLGLRWRIFMALRLWNSVSRAIIHPFGSLGDDGVIGRDYYDLASPIVLSSVSGTPANTAGPTSVTFPKAIIASDVPVRVSFGNRWRLIPVALMVLKDANSGKFATWV